ncbi:MAG TPA: nickel pincer cofactor biosynthesis protein LarB [bacterium]|nr:nickel pincer cofactor biosynthesis protein LarB [bacterium]
MDQEKLKELLKSVRNGDLDIQQAVECLKTLPYQDLGFAKIDTHRALRRGFPEVVFCEGKTVDQAVAILESMTENYSTVLGMRARPEIAEALKTKRVLFTYHPEARAIVIGEKPPVRYEGLILIVSAGTADMPVAEEAFLTAEALGNRVEKIYDAGVAGVHRLLAHSRKLRTARVLVVVAGMEGALPGVVGGLVDKPVIAVPTSVGYGTNFQGLSALLTMLNTCVPGIAVVNIDNGFGAGYMAAMINRLAEEKTDTDR